MASAGTKVTLLATVLVFAMAAATAMASTEYEVKWDFPTSNSYYGTTQGRTYNVGDKLTFVYMQELHNVVRVRSVTDFTECTTHTAMSPMYADGHTVVSLNEPGPHYFICSVPGHCEDGMKIKVLVKA